MMSAEILPSNGRAGLESSFDPAWDRIAEFYTGDVGVYDGQRRLMQELISPAWSVIDVGCGPGLHSLLLSRAGHEVVGVDRSFRMLQIARRTAARHELAPRFYCHDATDLRFPDRSFDVALSLNNTIGVVSGEENRHRAIQEMLRVAKRRCIIELLHGTAGMVGRVQYFRDGRGNVVPYQSRRFSEAEAIHAVGEYPAHTVRVRDSVLSDYFFALIVEVA